MKKLLLVLAAAAVLLPAAPVSQAADVSFNFFYDNLGGGNWIEVSDYGYCWQPDVAVSDTSWRPYSDGYWTYTDLGWTWVSYEDFGWATYHYGRWARLSDYGWVWVPGRDRDLTWGPAWVSWRTGGEYIGWAPLPPETLGIVYEGRPVRGHVDIEFGIGPSWYNFVDARYIGAPVLRERIVAVNQNITYVNQTVNVTNITYNNNSVYNYGPDYAVVNQHAAQPVQRLKLERQENVDVAAAAKSGALMKPQGDRLVVASPMHITKPTQSLVPPTVKTRVTKPNMDKGWGMVSDPKVKTDLEQKMKTEDVKQAQIGTGAGTTAGHTTAGAGANVNAAATASVPPTGHGRDKGKNATDNTATQSNVNAGANVNAAATASVPPTGHGRDKGRNATDKTATQSNVNAGANINAAATASVPPTGHGRDKGRNATDKTATQSNVNAGANADVNAGASATASVPATWRGKGKNTTNIPAHTDINASTSAETGVSVPPTDLTGAKGKHEKNATTGTGQLRQNPHAEFGVPSATVAPVEIDRHKAKNLETNKATGNWPNKPAVEQGAGSTITGPGEGKRFRQNDQLGNPPNTIGTSDVPNLGNRGRNKPEKVVPAVTGPQGGAPAVQEWQQKGKGKDKDKGQPVTSPTP